MNYGTYSNNCNSWLFLPRFAGVGLSKLGEMIRHRGVNVTVRCRLDVLRIRHTFFILHKRYFQLRYYNYYELQHNTSIVVSK